MSGETESQSEREIWDSLPRLSDRERGRAYFQLSGLAFENGQYLRSLTLAQSACDYFHQLHDDEGFAHSLASVAFSLYSLNRKEEAVRELLSAVMAMNKIEAREEWQYRHHLADWFKELERFEEAKGQMELCLQNSLYQEDRFAAACDYAGIGDITCDFGDCKDAIKNYESARALFKEMRDVKRTADMDIFIARCYNHLKDGISAESFAIRAVGVFESLSIIEKTAQSYSQMGRALINQARFEDALVWLDRAYQKLVSKCPHNFDGIYVIQELKIKALQALGRDNEAAELSRRNAALNETLQHEEAN